MGFKIKNKYSVSLPCLRSRNVPDQVLNLSVRSSWNGCLTKNSTTGGARMLECQGERRYEDARRMFIAVDNCRSLTGLVLGYHVEIYGYNTNDGGVCSRAASSVILQNSGLTKLTAAVVIVIYFSFSFWAFLPSSLSLRESAS